MPPVAHAAPIQRILFPQPGDEAARALYVRADPDAVSWTRSSLSISSGATASLATYFAGLPAAYWRAHTQVTAVTVVGEVAGPAVVRVCAADEVTPRRVIATLNADGAFSSLIDIAEGTWFWLEIDAGATGTTLRDAAWLADPAEEVSASVCITTHNRGADCVGVLRRLASDDVVTAKVTRVIVVDQGDRRVRDAAGFDEAVAALGDRFTLIEQGNLGGSGGFSRGMIEALDGRATHALLLDDDVMLEPESIFRMLGFAAHANQETIVGAQMLSLPDRTLLHSLGERIERRGFWWTSVAPALAPVDLAEATIESTPGLRIRHDVDYNGWWMCLIPLRTVRRIGVSLPLFIKWDDAELGLRAAAAGVPTVTLPGAALWHMPWTGKDDGLDWQAYYQLRNRLVTALLHSAAARGGGVLSASFAQDVNHLLCLQYGSAAARRVALRDVLEGPERLQQTLAHRTDDMRALMARAGQAVVPDSQLPRPISAAPSEPRPGRLSAFFRLLRVVVHQMRRPRVTPQHVVDVALRRSEGKWWALGAVDSATVASATGIGAFVARRDRAVSARLLCDAVALRAQLWVRWPRLARSYRAAAPQLASPDAWRDLFAAHGGGDPRSL